MNISNGSIIQFRYASPNKKQIGPQPAKIVLVLNNNYEGKLHGLYITQLSPQVQEILQNIFSKMYADNLQGVFVPMEQRIQKLRNELELLNKQQVEAQKQQNKVFLMPQNVNQLVSTVKSVKSVGASIFNKVKTFGRTQVQPQSVANAPQNQMIAQQNATLLAQKNDELNKVMALYQQQKSLYDNIPQVPKDPYMFYHQFLKAYIGDPRVMKQIYRKFNWKFIKTPRIERLPR